jgi:hypothetical protein
MSKERVMPKLEEKEVETLISILRGANVPRSRDFCIAVCDGWGLTCKNKEIPCGACALNSKEDVITWLSQK